MKLPSERTGDSGTPGVVDDPDMFLTADQVSALVAATPWPYNVLTHVADKARAVMDPFHVVHLAADKLTVCRQRVQHLTFIN
ncbi:transposase [Gordonia westfalica]|uniref:Transposase n=1 Tax=Gordonia westfalica TaxID=158898 RepID=A0ABU2GTK9_9ACTN|nr:transposase [Gordonia westfalica]MDS1114240.1 transposase [Gordonia westfalica]